MRGPNFLQSSTSKRMQKPNFVFAYRCTRAWECLIVGRGIVSHAFQTSLGRMLLLGQFIHWYLWKSSVEAKCWEWPSGHPSIIWDWDRTLPLPFFWPNHQIVFAWTFFVRFHPVIFLNRQCFPPLFWVRNVGGCVTCGQRNGGQWVKSYKLPPDTFLRHPLRPFHPVSPFFPRPPPNRGLHR